MRLVNLDAMNENLFYKQMGGKDTLITCESAFDMIKAQPVVFDSEGKTDTRLIVEVKDERMIPLCELSQFDIKAITIALYHQWRKTANDGKVVTCSQEMADTTYRMLELFDSLYEKHHKE